MILSKLTSVAEVEVVDIPGTVVTLLIILTTNIKYKSSLIFHHRAKPTRVATTTRAIKGEVDFRTKTATEN